MRARNKRLWQVCFVLFFFFKQSRSISFIKSFVIYLSIILQCYKLLYLSQFASLLEKQLVFLTVNQNTWQVFPFPSGGFALVNAVRCQIFMCLRNCSWDSQKLNLYENNKGHAMISATTLATCSLQTLPDKDFFPFENLFFIIIWRIDCKRAPCFLVSHNTSL